MKSDEVKGYLYMGGAVIGAYLLYKAVTKGAAVASAVGTALNPADSENIVNRGVTGLGQWLSGDEGWTLGGWIYNKTHADELTGAKPAIDVQGGILTPWGAAQAAADWVSPAQTTVFTQDQINRIGSAPALWTPTIAPSGSILVGPSFNDTANGNWSWF